MYGSYENILEVNLNIATYLRDICWLSSSYIILFQIFYEIGVYKTVRMFLDATGMNVLSHQFQELPLKRLLNTKKF